MLIRDTAPRGWRDEFGATKKDQERRETEEPSITKTDGESGEEREKERETERERESAGRREGSHDDKQKCNHGIR